MDIVKLSGVIKSYEWGDSYFISSLLNRKKSNYPQGELWMGTHPMGESTLLMDEIPLSQYIASSPIEVLGASHIKRFNEELPFLLKVLAIKNPLSLQVHPNSEQAKRGYEEETEQRGLTEAALLNYKDNRQKDEVLFAITPTTAMVGFRTLSEILENFSLILHEKGDIFVNCTSVEEFFETLFILDGNTKESMLLDLKEYVNTPSEIEPSLFLSSKEIAKRALSLYSDDIMVFAPFFLNVVHVPVGSAIHIAPTTLHSYVYGHGVELMSASDNVLRGGLTNKKIDVKELLSTLSYHEEKIELASITQLSDTYYTIDVDSLEFVFSYVEKGEVQLMDHSTAEIALVLDGNGKITWDQKEIRINKGDILLIPSIIDSYTIQNSGLVVIASVYGEK